MKKILKAIISRGAYYLGIWHLIFAFTSLFSSRKILVVFTYHRIVDNNSGKIYYLNYDRGLDTIAFEQQIISIVKYFEVVDLENYIAIIKGEKKPKKHTALITFDDGDSEFLKNAFPILQKYNCPAVVFSPTSYIDSANRFWHLRLSNAIENAMPEQWEKIKEQENSYPESLAKLIKTSAINTVDEKISTCQRLVNAIDKYKQSEIDEIIDTFEEIIGCKYSLGIQCLSWEQHQKLSQKGIRFDSHTVNHRKLAELSEDEIKSELIDSKSELEEKLNKEVLSICYPAGSYNEKVIELAPQCGYTVGFTTKPGLCNYPMDAREIFEIPRRAIDGANRYDIGLFMGKIALNKLTGGKHD